MAAPAPAAAPAAPAAAVPASKKLLKLAAPGLQQQIGISKELATFYSDHLSQQLALAGVMVTTSSEIQTVLGLERQRQLLGCSGEDCVSDSANILGVDGIVTGAVAKVGGSYQLNVKVIDAKNGSGLSAASVTAGSESELLEEMGRTARAIAKELFNKLDREPVGGTAQKDLSAGWVRRRAWIPGAAGVVLVGAGVPLLLSGNYDYNQLKNVYAPGGSNDIPGGQSPQSFAATGQLKQVLGLTMLSVGTAAIVGAGAMFLFGGEKEEPAKAVAPVALIAPIPSGGAMLTLSGALP